MMLGMQNVQTLCYFFSTAISCNVKPTLALTPSKSISKNLSKINENMCPHRDLCSNFIAVMIITN